MEKDEQIIDIKVFLKVLREHILPLILAAVIAAGIGFSLAYFVIPKRYTSEALMYVENSSEKHDGSSININDINAAQKLVNTCQILFTSGYVFEKLSGYFGNRYSTEDLRGMIKISSVNNTEVLRISAEAKSPDEACAIAKELVVLAKEEFGRIIKTGSIETVSEPSYPVRHTFPSTVKFTAIAAFIGTAGLYMIFLLKEIFDIKVKPDDDLMQIYDIPVFAEILDFEGASRSGKYSKYDMYSDEREQDSDTGISGSGSDDDDAE